MRVAYITAGAAGMYCGSCIHDNALAAALVRRDADVALIPTYTPLRTDEGKRLAGPRVLRRRQHLPTTTVAVFSPYAPPLRPHPRLAAPNPHPRALWLLYQRPHTRAAHRLNARWRGGEPTKGTHPPRRLAPARLQTRPHPANQRHVRRHGPAIKSTIRRPRPLRPPRRGPVLRRPSRTLAVPSPRHPTPTRPRHRRLHRPVCVLPRAHGRVLTDTALQNPRSAARPQSERTRPRVTIRRRPRQNRLPRPFMSRKGAFTCSSMPSNN